MVERKSPELGSLAVAPKVLEHQPTGVSGLDKVLGGGVVKGSALLFAGQRGVGKSSLLHMACAGLAAAGKKTLFVSAEESADDVVTTAHRLGSRDASIQVRGNMGGVQEILETLREIKPYFCVLDSISTMYHEDSGGSEGSNEQLMSIGNAFTAYGKKYGTVMFMVSHVNGKGEPAGPQGLQHLVDVILEMAYDFDIDPETGADAKSDRRVLTTTKNRRGKDGVEAWFTMTATGLDPADAPSYLDPPAGGDWREKLGKAKKEAAK